jgi:hypothetical protein
MLHTLLSKAQEHWSDAVLLLTVHPSPLVEIGKMVVVGALSSFGTNLITTARLEERIIYIQESLRQNKQEQVEISDAINDVKRNMILIQYRLDEKDREMRK